MTGHSTRRAILAGVASLPVLALPAAAIAGPDPVFAAIERHRAAVLAYFEAAKPPFEMNDDDPRQADLRGAMVEAMDIAFEAGRSLAETVPTTMSGILAVIAHVEAVNHGGIALATDRAWFTSPVTWPEGRQIEGEDMFGYDLLSNIGRALQAVAVQS